MNFGLFVILVFVLIFGLVIGLGFMAEVIKVLFGVGWALVFTFIEIVFMLILIILLVCEYENRNSRK